MGVDLRLAIGLLGIVSCASCSPEVQSSAAREKAVHSDATAGGHGEAGGKAAAGGAQKEIPPLILYDAPLGAPYPMARIEGVLQRDGNCLYLLAGEGERTLLVMPSPTASWNRARGTVQFGAKELRLGQRVAFGGRSAEIGSGEIADAAQRAGCDVSQVWMVSPQGVEVLNRE